MAQGGSTSRTHCARRHIGARRRNLFAASAALVCTLAATATAGAVAAGPPAAAVAVPGTTVSVESSPYGNVLMAGSGTFAGFTLYQFNRNTPAACTTTPTTVQNMSITCTGAETDRTADWPALTTVGRPVAGPGVKKNLLGMVYRKDIGADQVTYAGKLLYLFDQKPDQFTGANFMETTLPFPPWHGVWWLVSPSGGEPVTGPVAVTTQTQPDGASVLAADMFQGQGTTAIVVYTYSRDSKHDSTCSGSCALTWIPVLTTAPPQAGPGVPVGSLGEIRRSDGTRQLTYHGKPLYFYSSEVPRLDPSTGNPLNPATIGTGNGMSAPKHMSGTFSVVSATAH